MISSAFAQTVAPGGADGGFGTLIMLGIMFVMLYFMVILPQSKKAKEQKQLLEGLKKGDEVVAQGIIGKVTSIGDTYVGLEVAEGVVIHIHKSTITTQLPTGTYKDVIGK